MDTFTRVSVDVVGRKMDIARHDSLRTRRESTRSSMTDATPKRKLKYAFTTDWWFYMPQFIVDPDEEYFEAIHEEIKDVCSKLYSKMERTSCILSDGGKVSYGIPGFDWSVSPTISILRQLIQSRLHETPDYCLAHIYPDGNSSIAWHNDSEASMTSVVSISFGAGRLFRFRDIGTTRGWKFELRLKNGDLVYMKKGCQYVYEHQVPVEKRVTRPRINLTFRHFDTNVTPRLPKLQLPAALVKSGKVIYTIGHSNREFDEFLKILLAARVIKNVVDVRSMPYSNKFPWFNRESINERLARETLFKYHHVGKLGGRKKKMLEKGEKTRNTSIDVRGFSNYGDYMLTDEFEDGYGELMNIVKSGPTVYFCAEARYWQCHRRMLSDMLTHRGWTVLHLGIGSPTNPPKHVVWPIARGEGNKLVYDQ